MWREKFKNCYDSLSKSIADFFVKISLPKFNKDKLSDLDEHRLTLKTKCIKYSKEIIIAAVLLAVSITLGVIKFEQDEKKITISDNKAEEYFYEGNYSSAIDEYNKLSKADKENAWWIIKASEVYSVKGDLENSRKYMESAKKILVNDKDEASKAKVTNYIIFTEFMNKDYKQALDDGEAALKIFPKDRQIIKTMFTVYMANDQLSNASNLISYYPVDKKSAYDMAEYSRMLMIAGRWDEGFTTLKSAWDIDKDEYKIYDVLSQTYNYNKDTLLDKITTLSGKYPTDVSYKMWLAKIYSLSPDTSDEANDLLSSISGSDVGKIEVNLIKANILQNSNKNTEADQLLSKIIKEYPNDYRVLHTAGWYYLNKKDYSEALKYCKESIVKNKDYPDNYGFLMPEIMRAEGKGIEGEPYFRIALSKEPYNYNIMLNIANYYWNSAQNVDKSIEYFKMAEIIKPDDAEIKYAMANVYLNNNKLNDAIDLLKQCIKIDESEPKYHRMLGTIYLTQNNSSDGIKEIRYAYHADEDDILTLSNAGCYYITYEQDLQRGLYNLQKAYEGINSSTDADTKQKITDNYNKAKKLVDDYNNGKSNAVLKIPEFTLFY